MNFEADDVVDLVAWVVAMLCVLVLLVCAALRDAFDTFSVMPRRIVFMNAVHVMVMVDGQWWVDQIEN